MKVKYVLLLISLIRVQNQNKNTEKSPSCFKSPLMTTY